MSLPEISVQELQALRNENADIFILDVRKPEEHAICHLSEHLIPIDDLPNRLDELNKDQMIIVHCHAGGRAKRATRYLLDQGFKKVFNLRGGITAWANEIDPKMRKY